MGFGDGFEELADELEDFGDDLNDAEGDIEDELDTAVDRTTRQVVATMLRIVPVDTGELQRNIYMEQQSRKLRRRIVADTEYARAVEYGRGLVTITPNTAGALRFEIDGEEVVVSKVEQDPRDPQPFLKPSLRRHESTFRDEINDAMARVWREDVL